MRYALSILSFLGATLFVNACSETCALEISSWSGLYFGINGGCGWGEMTYDFGIGGGGSNRALYQDNLFANYNTGGSFKQKNQGEILGGHIGFNYQWKALLFGLEGSFEGSWIEKKSKNVFELGIVPTPTTTYSTNIQWFANLTPRLGYTFNNWLLYAKGGLSAARLEGRLHSSQKYQGQELSFSQQLDHVGWTVGGGVEYLLNSHWIGGIEYTHHHFSQGHYGGSSSPDTSWPITYTVQPKFNAILLRLSYKI